MSDAWGWMKRNKPDAVTEYNREALAQMVPSEAPTLFSCRPGEKGMVEQTAIIDGKFHVRALTVEQFALALAHAARVLAEQMRHK